MVITEQQTEVISEFESATSELITILSSLNEEQLNKVPFEDSWTAAQVGEHLRKSYTGIPQTLQGPVKPSNGDPGKNRKYKNTFLNFTIKMKSPEFIIPENKTYKKEVLISSLKDITSEIINTVKQLDVSKTCTGFSLPFVGELTRLEWMHFLLYHTQRHLQQLRNIADSSLQ